MRRREGPARANGHARGISRRFSGAQALATLSALLLVAGIAGAWLGWWSSRADPLVRRASITLDDWPAGARHLRVALLADIHLGNASTDRARLARVVALVDATAPDLVLIAGDFVAGYAPEGALRQTGALTDTLSRLHAPLGIVAVLGNHDNATNPAAIRRALEAAHIMVLENGAIRRGPLLIGGSGDTVSGHARLGGTLLALRRLEAARPGARIYLSHSPDIEKWLPPGPSLLLAGHTHCGQIVVPIVGAALPVSRVFGNRLRCGMVADGRKTVVVTSGIGTSYLPLRFGAPPDFWLLTLGGPAAR